MSRVLFIPLIGLLCAACTDGTVLHCYKPLPREGWDRRDTVCFSLPKTESDLDGSLIVGLRTAAHVDFQDIVLAVECCDEETGLCRCDTVRYPLTDAEGFPEIAAKFRMVGAIEKEHEERYRKLLANIEGGLVFSRDGDCIWQCSNCGHIVIGPSAPDVCPVCDHPKSYFQLKAENY